MCEASNLLMQIQELSERILKVIIYAETKILFKDLFMLKTYRGISVTHVYHYYLIQDLSLQFSTLKI
jgi:hypothetical protein